MKTMNHQFGGKKRRRIGWYLEGDTVSKKSLFF